MGAGTLRTPGEALADVDRPEHWIIRQARALADDTGSATIVAEDRDVLDAAASSQVPWMHAKGTLGVLSGGEPAENLVQLAARLNRTDNWRLGRAAGLGGLIALALQQAWTFRQVIASTANVWGTIAGIIVSGVALFVLRAKLRLWYAVVEVLVGIAIGAHIFYPDFKTDSITVASSLQVLGSLYVIVRGCDNFAKGMTTTRWRAWWEPWSR